MNYSDMVPLTSGLLQFGVACYTLRLSRLFRAPRVGWVLFSALCLLAVIYVLLPVSPFRGNLQWMVKADMVYALISLLLLTGMAHIERRVYARVRREEAEKHAQKEFIAQLQINYAQAAESRDELKQTVARLEHEMAEQKSMQEEAEKTSRDLLMNARQTEEELRQNIERIQIEAESEKCKLQETASGKETEIGNLQAELGQAKDNLADTREELATFKAQIATCQGQIDSSQSQIASLQAQIDTFKSQLVASQAQLTNSRGMEEELRKALDKLEAELQERQAAHERDTRKMHKALQTATRQASVTRFTDRVLPQVDQVLKQLEAASSAADDVVHSSIAHISRVGKINRPLSSEPARVKQLPNGLAHLCHHLTGKQMLVLRKIDTARKKMEEIKGRVLSFKPAPIPAPMAAPAARITEIVQDATPVLLDGSREEALTEQAGEPAVPAASPLPPQSGLQEHLINNVTETGTELAESTPEAALEELPPIVLDPATENQNWEAPPQLPGA